MLMLKVSSFMGCSGCAIRRAEVFAFVRREPLAEGLRLRVERPRRSARRSARRSIRPSIDRRPAMSASPSRPDVPEGFHERRFGEGFIGVNGPLYARRTKRSSSSAFASSGATATRWGSATAA